MPALTQHWALLYLWQRSQSAEKNGNVTWNSCPDDKQQQRAIYCPLTLFLLFLRRNKKSNEEVFLLPRYIRSSRVRVADQRFPFYIHFKILSSRWAGKRRKESEEYISRPAMVFLWEILVGNSNERVSVAEIERANKNSSVMMMRSRKARKRERNLEIKNKKKKPHHTEIEQKQQNSWEMRRRIVHVGLKVLRSTDARRGKIRS